MQPLFLGIRDTLGDKRTHTLQSSNDLIGLCDAWAKPEEAEQWRVELLEIQSPAL